MNNPLSCINNTRTSYRKDLGKVITEVQVQFKDENPAWIPYETLIAIQSR
jgi:hypothetical protein